MPDPIPPPQEPFASERHITYDLRYNSGGALKEFYMSEVYRSLESNCNAETDTLIEAIERILSDRSSGFITREEFIDLICKEHVNKQKKIDSLSHQVFEFFRVFQSPSLSSQRTDVTKAIHTVLETGLDFPKNMKISEDFLLEKIQEKYGVEGGFIDVFLKDLSDLMGENYPPDLSYKREIEGELHKLGELSNIKDIVGDTYETVARIKLKNYPLEGEFFNLFNKKMDEYGV
jgi:hypothetical protein